MRRLSISAVCVLHAIAGPTDAETILREAKWVVETRKLATLEAAGDIKKYAPSTQT